MTLKLLDNSEQEIEMMSQLLIIQRRVGPEQGFKSDPDNLTQTLLPQEVMRRIKIDNFK
jgi:hypothetical protein